MSENPAVYLVSGAADQKRFKADQLDMMPSATSHMLYRFRERYLEAARLLEIDNDVTKRLWKTKLDGYHGVNRLIKPYMVLADRYFDELYDPQIDYIYNADVQSDMQWSNYFYHELIPYLLKEDMVVRGALRSLQIIESYDPDSDMDHLCHEFSVMQMPSKAQKPKSFFADR